MKLRPIGVSVMAAWAASVLAQPAPTEPAPQPPVQPETAPAPVVPPKPDPKAEPVTEPAAAPAPGSAPTTNDGGDPKKSAEPPPAAPAGHTTPTGESPIVEAVIYFKDGRRLTGYLVSQDEKQTVVRIEGIDTKIEAPLIERVEILPPVEERYKKLREAIQDDDVERRLLLVEWLINRRQYELATTEITGVLKVAPENSQAKKMKLLLEQQQAVDRAAAELKAKGIKAPKGTEGGEPGKRAAFPLLETEDVNLIRVFQVNLNDPPKMSVPREVVDDLIKKYADRPEIPASEEGRQALYRKRPNQLLRLLFELKARELYPMVKVQEDPASMKLFRDNVWGGWVKNACASTRCHGGEEAGKLWLSNTKSNADRTIYTNYLILHRFKLPDGTPLIDYDKPADSPLLQLAMERNASRRPHPRVEAVVRSGQEPFKPVFDSPLDRRFQETVEWIKAMYVPEGKDYPVKYVAPVPGDSKKTSGPTSPAAPADRKSDPGR